MNKIILSTLLVFTFFTASHVAGKEDYLIILTLVILGLLLLYTNIRMIQIAKERLLISLMLVTSIFLLKRMNLSWVDAWGIDPATFLFFALLPAILFLRISSTTNAVFALMLLVFTAFYSINKYDKTAEVFAILVFFLLTTSVLQSIKNLCK